MRRLLIPFARRVSDANLLARATLRRDPALLLPPVVVDAPARAIVVAPHPDDEAIGCGGTLALAHDSTVVFLTGDGERRREAERSCAALGVGETHFLALPEGKLDESAQAIAAALTSADGATVLVPWPLESQADHVAAARLVAAALAGRDVRIWCYEVWSPLEPNRLVDITAVHETKRAAVRCHASQTQRHDFEEAALGLNRYRSLLAPGATYSEAFLELDADALRTLAA